MQIDNVNIYNLAEAIAASGLPMMALYDRKDFRKKSKFLEWRDFCEWIEGLLLSFLITNQTPEKNIDQIADDFISDWGE